MTVEAIAGAWWAIVHTMGVVMAVAWYQRERQRFYLYVAVSWAFMALWGVTVSGNGWVHWFNAVVTPLVAGVFGLAYLVEANRHMKRRITVVVPMPDGTLNFVSSSLPPPRSADDDDTMVIRRGSRQ